MPDDQRILTELRRMNALLKVAFYPQLEAGLTSVATTRDRRRIWTHIDGRRTSKDLSKDLGIARRTVDYFLSVAESAGLIENPRGRPPVRLVDIAPSKWAQPELDEEKPRREDTNG